MSAGSRSSPTGCRSGTGRNWRSTPPSSRPSEVPATGDQGRIPSRSGHSTLPRAASAARLAPSSSAPAAAGALLLAHWPAAASEHWPTFCLCWCGTALSPRPPCFDLPGCSCGPGCSLSRRSAPTLALSLSSRLEWGRAWRGLCRSCMRCWRMRGGSCLSQPVAPRRVIATARSAGTFGSCRRKYARKKTAPFLRGEGVHVPARDEAIRRQGNIRSCGNNTLGEPGHPFPRPRMSQFHFHVFIPRAGSSRGTGCLWQPLFNRLLCRPGDPTATVVSLDGRNA